MIDAQLPHDEGVATEGSAAEDTATESLLRKAFAAPARMPRVPMDPRPAILELNRRQRRRFRVVFLTVVLVIVAAVGIPAVATALSADPAVSLTAPAAGSGLLPWAPRGDRIHDERAIAVAERAWGRRVEANPPVRDVHLLYAATSSEGTWVVLQGFDRQDRPTGALIRYASGGAFVEWANAVPAVPPAALYLPDGLLATRILLAPQFASASAKVTLREDVGPTAETGPSAAVAADGLTAPVPLATELPSNEPFGFDISGVRNGKLVPVGSGVATFGKLFADPAPVTVTPSPAGWAADSVPSGRMLDVAEKARNQLHLPTLEVSELGQFPTTNIAGKPVAGEALLARNGDRAWLVTGFAFDENTLACVSVAAVTTSPRVVAGTCRTAFLGSAAAPATSLWLAGRRLVNQSTVTIADPAPGAKNRVLEARSAAGQVVGSIPVPTV
jgi:hypothetical protein